MVKSETRRDAQILVRNPSPRLFGKKVSRLKKSKNKLCKNETWRLPIFRDFEILPKFSENHVFRGTIRHPYQGQPIQGKNLSRDILVSKEEFKHRIDQYSVTKRTSLSPFFNCCLSRLGIWSGPSNTKTKNSQCEHFEHINDYYHFFFTTLNDLLFS